MELFEITSLIAIGALLLVGAVVGPIIQVIWTLRILIASYIALCLTLLLPHHIDFGWYTNGVFFCGIAALFISVGEGRFYDVSGWYVGRFSFRLIGLSILLWFFIGAVACTLIPLSQIDIIMTRAVYDMLRENIFYFSVAPLIFTFVFSRHAR